MFRGIASTGFPPFGEFRLLLPPVPDQPEDLAEVHLLAGVNGTGKTRLLALLAAMMGWDQPLKARLKGVEKPIPFYATATESGNSSDPLGQGLWTERFLAKQDGCRWQTSGQLSSFALKVPAFAYSGAAYVSDAAITAMADTPRPDRQLCLSFERPPTHSQQLLQAIANLKIQAAMDLMNGHGDKEPTTSHAAAIVEAMERAISEITSLPFSFQITSYPKTALEVSWAGVKLPVDLLPDGLRSVIGWLVHPLVMLDAWLQGQGTPMESEVVFLLDEIENHLHPAWQRRILPAFQGLFPKAQIIMATHSPFVISSLNHGWIHPLTLNSNGTVGVEEPLPASPGDSYLTVLEDIMGVPEWYDPETENLLREFREKRDAAYAGDAGAGEEARRLAESIGRRSPELGHMMGRELSQMDRQLPPQPAAP